MPGRRLKCNIPRDATQYVFYGEAIIVIGVGNDWAAIVCSRERCGLEADADVRWRTQISKVASWKRCARGTQSVYCVNGVFVI